MERPVGIEPTWSAWKAEARPLGEGRRKPAFNQPRMPGYLGLVE